MKSRAERLKDILVYWAFCNKPANEVEGNFKIWTLDETASEIIALFKECVPNERRTDFEIVTIYENGKMYTSKTKTMKARAEMNGSNICRTETLKNMDELR